MEQQQKPVVTIIIFALMVVAAITVLITSFLAQRRSQAPDKASAGVCDMRFVVQDTTRTPTTIQISPGALTGLEAGGSPVAMSTTVLDQDGADMTGLVTLNWGISSSGTVGTLKQDQNKRIAQFVPLNAGTGDLFITATYQTTTIERSIPIQVNPPAPKDDFRFAPVSSTQNSFKVYKVGTTKEVNPARLIAGQTYTVSYDNVVVLSDIRSSQPNSTTIAIQLRINGTQLDSATAPYTQYLSSGSVKTKFNVPFVARGDVNTFTLTADASNAVTESNESNNTLETAVQVNLPKTKIRTKADSVTGSPSQLSAKVKIGFVGESQPYYDQILAFTKEATDTYAVDLPDETYEEGKVWIAVKGEKHVQRILSNQEFSASQTIDMTTLVLAPGDTPPQDGRVDVNDINKILSVIPKASKTPQEIFATDLNYDSVVNAADISAILKTLSTKSDELPF